MSWLDALVDHLDTNNVAEKTVTLFRSMMPETGDEPVIALARYKGTNREVMGGNGLRLPMLQLAARGKDYAATEDLIEEARDVLAAIVNQSVQGVRFARVRPDGDVKDLKRDSKGRQMFTQDFEVWFQDA